MTIRQTWLLLILLHLLPVVAGGWAGLRGAIATLAGVHLALLACTLWPRATPFGPAQRTFPARGKELCLTIDDGPRGDTLELLELLAAHQARAVFFLIGERAAARPDLVQAIVSAGHRIGNHTHTHPAHWFWAYGPARQRQEIQTCSNLLTALAGTAPRWFRAPAGFRNPFTGPLLRELNLTCMGWSARSFDTRGLPVPRLLQRLRFSFRPGAILLVHQGHPHSVAFIQSLLESLTAAGWQVVLPPDPPPDPPPGPGPS